MFTFYEHSYDPSETISHTGDYKTVSRLLTTRVTRRIKPEIGIVPAETSSCALVELLFLIFYGPVLVLCVRSHMFAVNRETGWLIN